MRAASAIELEAALTRARLGSSVWTAMLGMNQSELEALVGARPNVCCLIYSPDKKEEDEEEQEDENEEETEEETEEEEEEDKVKSQDRVRRRA